MGGMGAPQVARVSHVGRTPFVLPPIQEFGVGMAGLLRGSPEERAESLFEVFDLSARGRLVAADIKPFFPATRGDEMSEFIGEGTFAATVISFLFEQIQTTIGAVQRGPKVQVRRYACAGAGLRGRVQDPCLTCTPFLAPVRARATRDQFVALCSQAPLWYDCFLSAVLCEVDKSPFPAFRNVQPSCSRFNMDMLVALWNRCQTTHDGRTGLSLPRFRVFMMEDFACTPDMLPLATRVFNLFDDDASGELDWRELVAGLSKVCAIGWIGRVPRSV